MLADEINRATPKTQSALLEAMQEQPVTVAKTTYKLPQPFFVLATQNPLEMEGTYPLPEAQLDRFFFKLNVAFPSRDELHTILDRTTRTRACTRARSSAGRGCSSCASWCARCRSRARAGLRDPRPAGDAPAGHPDGDGEQARRASGQGDKERDKDLVRRFVRYGCSPRGAQALLLGAKMRALLDGRFAASCDDIKAVARPALRHRLILNFEGEAEGIAPTRSSTPSSARTPEP